MNSQPKHYVMQVQTLHWGPLLVSSCSATMVTWHCSAGNMALLCLLLCYKRHKPRTHVKSSLFKHKLNYYLIQNKSAAFVINKCQDYMSSDFCKLFCWKHVLIWSKSEVRQNMCIYATMYVNYVDQTFKQIILNRCRRESRSWSIRIQTVRQWDTSMNALNVAICNTGWVAYTR